MNMLRTILKVGSLDEIERLLQDPSFDPSADSNYAIRLASEYGHLEIVKLLLKDPRVDPSGDSDAIRWASEGGHLDVVELLLKDPRVASDINNSAFRWASSNGHLEVVELLLKDPRIDSLFDFYYAIKWAAYHRHAHVVERLLFDERVLSQTSPDFSIFYDQSAKVEKIYKRLYTRLRTHVCTMMFGMQDLDVPALQLLMILDELDDIYPLIPMHIKWNMIVKIKHFKPHS